jgi:hypothetical protein
MTAALETKAKTLRNRGSEPLNGAQKMAPKSFSTRWVVFDTAS